ncbi:MAG TPA: hypothetical protein VFI58_06345 [Xanthobacteraceae bacterium]|jgi:hypothetical protein|nr:hypothetical protein [Xanthobacteraceae bacterium]
MTSKFLFTTCALLLSLPALAQEWTNEEKAAGLKTTEYTRHIPAGKQRTLDNFGYLNPDCTLVEDTDTVISKEPEHGSAVIAVIERFPAYAKDNIRSKCNEKKMRMPVLTYKAAVGYAGTDAFEVLSVSSNGVANLFRYTIKIVDVDSKKKGRADLRP